MENYKRLNTVKVQFPESARRPTAMEIHEWLVNTFHLSTDNCDTIQLVDKERAIYIKVVSVTMYNKILNNHQSHIAFQYANSESVQVEIGSADTENITVRLFNLPPEIPISIVRSAMSKYGTVRDVRSEKWNERYLIPVNNGVKAVKIDIKTPIPPIITIARYSVTVSYPGQKQVCFRCGEEGHIKQNCTKVTTMTLLPHNQRRTLADIVKESTENNIKERDDKEQVTSQNKTENNSDDIDFPPLMEIEEPTENECEATPEKSGMIFDDSEEEENELDDNNTTNDDNTPECIQNKLEEEQESEPKEKKMRRQVEIHKCYTHKNKKQIKETNTRQAENQGHLTHDHDGEQYVETINSTATKEDVLLQVATAETISMQTKNKTEENCNEQSDESNATQNKNNPMHYNARLHPYRKEKTKGNNISKLGFPPFKK